MVPRRFLRILPISTHFLVNIFIVVVVEMNVRQLAPWTIRPRQLDPELQTRQWIKERGIICLVVDQRMKNNFALRFGIIHLCSLRVAVPSPEEKRDGGNVYEKLTRIVLCDVTLLYGNI